MLQRAAVLSVIICSQLGCSVLLSPDGEPTQDFEPGSDVGTPNDAQQDVPGGWGFSTGDFLPLTGSYEVSTTSSDPGNVSTSETAGLVLASDDAGNPVAVSAADVIRIEAGSAIVASGALPLVLLANRIVINGSLDVSSSTAANRTDASGGALCAAQSGLSEAGGVGGSGARGGGLGGSNPARASGRSPRFLSGGCRGGHGAVGGVRGGEGGGAVQLIALSSMELGIDAPATLFAGGGGGSGGTASQDVGGGGGGAGGMIVLDSPSITIGSHHVSANGGDGGGGGLGQPGTDGGFGVAQAPAAAVVGSRPNAAAAVVAPPGCCRPGTGLTPTRAVQVPSVAAAAALVSFSCARRVCSARQPPLRPQRPSRTDSMRAVAFREVESARLP